MITILTWRGNIKTGWGTILKLNYCTWKALVEQNISSQYENNVLTLVFELYSNCTVTERNFFGGKHKNVETWGMKWNKSISLQIVYIIAYFIIQKVIIVTANRNSFSRCIGIHNFFSVSLIFMPRMINHIAFLNQKESIHYWQIGSKKKKKWNMYNYNPEECYTYCHLILVLCLV